MAIFKQFYYLSVIVQVIVVQKFHANESIFPHFSIQHSTMDHRPRSCNLAKKTADADAVCPDAAIFPYFSVRKFIEILLVMFNSCSSFHNDGTVCYLPHSDDEVKSNWLNAVRTSWMLILTFGSHI